MSRFFYLFLLCSVSFKAPVNIGKYDINSIWSIYRHNLVALWVNYFVDRAWRGCWQSICWCYNLVTLHVTAFAAWPWKVKLLQGDREFGIGMERSYCSLLRRRSLGSSRNFPPPRTSAEARGTFLALCSKRSARKHVEITGEPIGARLLFNRKPIISCDRTTSKFPRFVLLMENRFRPNPFASCMEDTPKKIVGDYRLLCNFPLYLRRE